MIIAKSVDSHSMVRGNILSEPLWREFFFEFFCFKWRNVVYFIFLERRLGSPNVTGPGVTYPLIPAP